MNVTRVAGYLFQLWDWGFCVVGRWFCLAAARHFQVSGFFQHLFWWNMGHSKWQVSFWNVRESLLHDYYLVNVRHRSRGLVNQHHAVGFILFHLSCQALIIPWFKGAWCEDSNLHLLWWTYVTGLTTLNVLITQFYAFKASYHLRIIFYLPLLFILQIHMHDYMSRLANAHVTHTQNYMYE